MKASDDGWSNEEWMQQWRVNQIATFQFQKLYEAEKTLLRKRLELLELKERGLLGAESIARLLSLTQKS